jgi:hypothetical protein
MPPSSAGPGPARSVESLLRPELPADLGYLDSRASSLLAGGGACAADARSILRTLASAAAAAQAWAKPDQVLAAATMSKCCACLYRDAGAGAAQQQEQQQQRQQQQRPEVEVQHYSSLRRLVALGAFGDALEHGARLSERLHQLIPAGAREAAPGKELRDLLLGTALNMLVCCAEAGAAGGGRGAAPIAQLHGTLLRLRPALELLPEGERAKHTDSIFRYLYKLSVQACGGSGLEPAAHRRLLEDLLDFCCASAQRAKLPLIVAKLAADLPAGAKPCLLSAALARLPAARQGGAALLHQGLELLAQQAAQQGDAGAFLRGAALPSGGGGGGGGGAEAAAQLYTAALQLAAQAGEAGAERAATHAAASTSGRQLAPSGSSGRGKAAAAAAAAAARAAAAAAAAGGPGCSATLAAYLQMARALVGEQAQEQQQEQQQQPANTALQEAAGAAAAATQALRAVISQLAGQAPSLQRYAELFPTPASAAAAAEALALAPALLRSAGGSEAALQPSAAAACALLALKITAGLALAPDADGCQLQQFQRHAGSAALLLPAADAGSAGAAGQLAASLAQLTLGSSDSGGGGSSGGGSGAVLSGEELQWLSSCAHNLAVELLAPTQPQTPAQQQLAAAALQLACRACLCQLTAAAQDAPQLLAEAAKKGKAYLGCLRKAGQLAQLVQEADAVMLQLHQVGRAAVRAAPLFVRPAVQRRSYLLGRGSC